MRGGAARCGEVLGGAGRCWEVLGGAGRCWEVLGGAGRCGEVRRALEGLGEGGAPLEAERLEELGIRGEVGVGRGEEFVTREDRVRASHEHDRLAQAARR